MRFAVLSCSRSGSTYASVFFKQLGFDFGHESLREDGGVGWPLLMVVEREFFDVVLHQVRNPWDAIASMPTHVESMWKKIYRFLGEEMPKGRPERCLKYWIEWNKRCEEIASMTYRVEDLRRGTTLVDEMSRMLCFRIGAVPEVSRTTNSRRKMHGRRYLGADTKEYFRKNNFLLYCEAMELCERYGYDVS